MGDEGSARARPEPVDPFGSLGALIEFRLVLSDQTKVTNTRFESRRAFNCDHLSAQRQHVLDTRACFGRRKIATNAPTD